MSTVAVIAVVVVVVLLIAMLFGVRRSEQGRRRGPAERRGADAGGHRSRAEESRTAAALRNEG